MLAWLFGSNDVVDSKDSVYTRKGSIHSKEFICFDYPMRAFSQCCRLLIHPAVDDFGSTLTCAEQ